MRARLGFLFLIWLALPPSGQCASVPQFAQYSVPIYNGPVGRLNLSPPGAYSYRTRLRDGAKQPVNFAGHYQLVQWGCGTQCNTGAMIDALTGKVTFLPSVVTGGMEAAIDAAFNAVEFRANSRLVVFSGRINEAGILGTHFDLWNGSQFQELLTVPFVSPSGTATQGPATAMSPTKGNEPDSGLNKSGFEEPALLSSRLPSVPGQHLPAPTASASPNTPPSTVSRDVISLDDLYLCGQALSLTRRDWEADSAYANYVAEAKRRGLTVSQCQVNVGFVNSASTTQTADTQQPAKESIQQSEGLQQKTYSILDVSLLALLDVMIVLGLFGTGFWINRLQQRKDSARQQSFAHVRVQLASSGQARAPRDNAGKTCVAKVYMRRRRQCRRLTILQRSHG